MILDPVLRFIIRKGDLKVIWPDGGIRHYGDGNGRSCAIKLHRQSLPWTLAMQPRLRIPEAYIEGDLTIEEGTLQDFLYLTGENLADLDTDGVNRMFQFVSAIWASFQHYNPISRSQKNVAHHYDLDGDFFRLFLDKDLQYSCAYFKEPGMDIDEAQTEKKALIAKKLRLEPGMKVLDIGSGWGGLGLYLAQNYDCEVYGVTLSREQHKVSNQRAADLGLSDKVRFDLKDYRLLDERFDRIVSVGMFEHVGPRHYDAYFARVKELLKDDGIALLHTIGRMGTPQPISPFMRKYIFPGAYLPSLSQITGAIERQWLWMTDFEVWRHHYADTLLKWNERFQENRDKVRDIYDERFCRMWELYLLGCEMSFRIQEMCVFQVQLARRIDTAPMTRDYMYRN